MACVPKNDMMWTYETGKPNVGRPAHAQLDRSAEFRGHLRDGLVPSGGGQSREVAVRGEPSDRRTGGDARRPPL